MHALIDGDLVLHACTQQFDDDPEHAVFGAAKRMVWNIAEGAGADNYELLLSGDGNFRTKIYPEYKAHRPKEKPKHFEPLKRYLVEYQGGRIVEGEADDELGIMVYQDWEQAVADARFEGCDPKMLCNFVLCSSDKDLDMIPGYHYNPPLKRHGEVVREGREYFIEESTGWYNFFKQLLTGDSTDNIPGLPRVGPKTAEKVLDGLCTTSAMATAVRDEYEAREFDWKYLALNADLIWILRERGVTGRQILARLL